MGGKIDQAKGRAKQAAGVLVGDKDLEREGKLDRAAGEVKEFADDVKKVASKVVDKVKSAVKG